MSDDNRRRLWAVLALVAGAFLALTLFPVNVTGPLGSAIGPSLWEALGIGALGAPVLGFLLALAGFDRLPRLDMKRAAILTVSSTILIPYVIAVLARADQSFYLDPLAEWSWSARLTGWLPGFLARSAIDSIGVAGGLLVGFVVLTATTLGTLAWHPLQRLEKPVEAPPLKAGRAVPVKRPALVEAEEDAADEEEVSQEELFPPSRGKPKVKRSMVEELELPLPPPRPVDEALPPLDLLDLPKGGDAEHDEAVLQRLGELLLATLKTFKVEGTLAGITSGPTVSQFEVVPASGVKAGRIVALADDLAITMRAQSLRVAPIPGRGAVGVEIPNPSPRMVTLRELLASEAWRNSSALLPIAIGRDVEGKPVVADLAKMPHLLVAGATGSGKSVAINTIVTSLIFRYTPRELRLLMVDPKMVELSMYNDLPHLRHKVVTDNNDAAALLKWAVYEMNRRYELLHANGARQLGEFNRKVREGKPLKNPASAKPTLTTIAREAPDTTAAESWNETYTEGELPMIVLIVDELADLMMTVQAEVERPLAMLAQKARAIGIHLILATQRPSVNVLTGLIKANFPARIAFRVASKVDSRTILDQNGAEALLGNGDMLFLPPGRNEPQRIQGAYISTEETERAMAWYVAQRDVAAHDGHEEDILAVVRAQAGEGEEGGTAHDGERDALFKQAAELCVQHQGGSTSLLQRRLGIGYGRAARIIDQLHDAGILGPPNGSKPRDVMIGVHQVEEYT
ncbi:MAG: DNA translocase FtsK [Gemmatimonadales bacterium]|nr:DNA translocase FtsK [Gemmatimonadales bacterium]